MRYEAAVMCTYTVPLCYTHNGDASTQDADTLLQQVRGEILKCV